MPRVVPRVVPRRACMVSLPWCALQVGGKPLSWEDVQPFLVKFDQIDALGGDQNGRIVKEDLEAMVQRSTGSAKRKVEESYSTLALAGRRGSTRKSLLS